MHPLALLMQPHALALHPLALLMQPHALALQRNGNFISFFEKRAIAIH
jgi:hypothetical protein